MTASTREVYGQAPLVLAAVEIRHTPTADLTQQQVLHLKQALAHVTPLLRDSQVATMQLSLGGESEQPAFGMQTVPRLVSRDRATAVTFRREAVVVETTRYDRFERLRDLVLLAVRERQAVAAADGVDRVGVRYVDEIRVPDVGAVVDDWQGWVAPALLGPAAMGVELSLVTRQMQGVVVFDVPPDQMLVLRHGPAVGYAVDPAGDLKRTTTTPGPFFLLDMDSSWTATEETPPVDSDWLRDKLDGLHEPVHALFEGLITDKLRNEVLRRHG